MLKLTVTITGESTEDLLIALEKVMRNVDESYTSGFGESEDSSFKFNIDKDDR